jgi:hypothetical protein
VLDDAPSVLPIRADYLPNISSLVDFSSRICAGGVLIMFALARGEPHNDFYFPVQRRASNISDGRGSFALVPQAFHQPGVGLPDEVHFYWTAYREIFEELFEGEEVEKENHHLIHDWYFDVSQPMQYFREHEGAFDEKLVGFGIDANSGNYLLPIVFLVRDTWYWKTFSQEMKKNWEIANIEWISTKDQNRILEILKYGNWTNESLYGLITGLNYLKRTEPRKVDLPDIEFIFGS